MRFGVLGSTLGTCSGCSAQAAGRRMDSRQNVAAAVFIGEIVSPECSGVKRLHKTLRARHDPNDIALSSPQTTRKRHVPMETCISDRRDGHPKACNPMILIGESLK